MLKRNGRGSFYLLSFYYTIIYFIGFSITITGYVNFATYYKCMHRDRLKENKKITNYYTFFKYCWLQINERKYFRGYNQIVTLKKVLAIQYSLAPGPC